MAIENEMASDETQDEQIQHEQEAEFTQEPEAEDAPSEADQLREELAIMRDKWVRAVAETDNLRKRAKKEQEETSRYAITGFAREMVDVLENLIRASDSIPAEAKEENELLKTLGEGVDLTRSELLNIFEKYAIKRLSPIGEKFDHNFHQAVVQVENNEVESGTVLEVLQAGYVIHNRLLRPAMVAVSKRGEQPPEAGSVDTMA